MQSFPTAVFQILLREHKTFLLKPNLRGKDLSRLLRPKSVVYYEQSQSSIMNKAGRLLRPTSVIYYDQARSSTNPQYSAKEYYKHPSAKAKEFYGRRKIPRHVLSFIKKYATASKKTTKANCTRFKAAKPFRQQCQRSFYGELHLLYIRPL